MHSTIIHRPSLPSSVSPIYLLTNDKGSYHSFDQSSDLSCSKTVAIRYKNHPLYLSLTSDRRINLLFSTRCHSLRLVFPLELWTTVQFVVVIITYPSTAIYSTDAPPPSPSSSSPPTNIHPPAAAVAALVLRSMTNEMWLEWTDGRTDNLFSGWRERMGCGDDGETSEGLLAGLVELLW